MSLDSRNPEWLAMVQRFDELGRETESALVADTERVTRLLEERDVLLTQLAGALAAPEDEAAVTSVRAALSGSASDTAALITQVAERTDALRRALRELDRGSRATNAYHLTSGAYPQVDARR